MDYAWAAVDGPRSHGGFLCLVVRRSDVAKVSFPPVAPNLESYSVGVVLRFFVFVPPFTADYPLSRDIVADDRPSTGWDVSRRLYAAGRKYAVISYLNDAFIQQCLTMIDDILDGVEGYRARAED